MRTMTLGELKEAIEDLVCMHGEDVLDMAAYAAADYGDHCHTMQLVPLEKPDFTQPRESGYSDSGLAMASRYEEEEEEEDEDRAEVVVFSRG